MNKDEAIKTIERILEIALDMEFWANRMFQLGVALGMVEVTWSLIGAEKAKEYSDKIDAEVKFLEESSRIAKYKVKKRV